MSEFAEVVKVGTTIELSGTFTPAGSSTATDPTGVVAYIRKPDGTLITKTYGVDAELTKTSTGVYKLRYALTAAGTWWIALAGTGTVAVVAETAFRAQTRNAA